MKDGTVKLKCRACVTHVSSTGTACIQNCFQDDQPVANTIPLLHATVAPRHFQRTFPLAGARQRNHGSNTMGKNFSQAAVAISRHAPVGLPFRRSLYASRTIA